MNRRTINSSTFMQFEVTNRNVTIIIIVNKLSAERPGFDFRQSQGFFLFSAASRPTFRPTQPPIQWVSGFFPRE
jgi:hypothetical protein